MSRLNKIAGQIAGIKKMVEDERDCSDVLTQIAAVRAALAKLAVIITEDHLETCIADSFQKGKGRESIGSLSKALKQILR